MAIRTYYHVLGVSRDATPEEITNAKTALAKVYHPDANIRNNIDTTQQMQEILEAYRVLSDPGKRKEYDRELSGGTNRVFKTFTVGAPDPEEEKDSFVTCWNAANSLIETVNRSAWLLERESRRKSFPLKVLEHIGKYDSSEKKLNAQLEQLSLKSLQYITILKTAGIPMEYWQPETMNWLLIHWGQNQNIDYQTLLAQYDAHINQSPSNTEKKKLRTKNKHFHHDLKKLLAYAL